MHPKRILNRSLTGSRLPLRYAPIPRAKLKPRYFKLPFPPIPVSSITVISNVVVVMSSRCLAFTYLESRLQHATFSSSSSNVGPVSCYDMSSSSFLPPKEGLSASRGGSKHTNAVPWDCWESSDAADDDDDDSNNTSNNSVVLSYVTKGHVIRAVDIAGIDSGPNAAYASEIDMRAVEGGVLGNRGNGKIVAIKGVANLRGAGFCGGRRHRADRKRIRIDEIASSFHVAYTSSSNLILVDFSSGDVLCRVKHAICDNGSRGGQFAGLDGGEVKIQAIKPTSEDVKSLSLKVLLLKSGVVTRYDVVRSDNKYKFIPIRGVSYPPLTAPSFSSPGPANSPISKVLKFSPGLEEVVYQCRDGGVWRAIAGNAKVIFKGWGGKSSDRYVYNILYVYNATRRNAIQCYAH